jgi:DNA-directed RNA polymerases I, II, and III subunit RPABC3
MFEDRFKIEAIDPDNKTPFRNVSRVHMISEYKLTLEVDINTQIYPISSTDAFMIKVTNCNNVKNIYSQDELNKPSEKDNYEYVSYGVVFDIAEKNGDLTVFASFGGLIMRVSGKANFLSAFRNTGKEARIYLMIKKA